MNLLQNLCEAGPKYKADMSDTVPVEMIKEIQKNIRDGASNPKLKWANALELAHKAYKVANVQRPFPSMKNAWKQYEENIQYAVAQLATHHGMKADWRMSSSIFREALTQKEYKVDVFNGMEKESYIIESANVDEVLNKIVKETLNAYDVELFEKEDEIHLIPRKFGIKQPFRVVVKES